MLFLDSFRFYNGCVLCGMSRIRVHDITHTPVMNCLLCEFYAWTVFCFLFNFKLLSLCVCCDFTSFVGFPPSFCSTCVQLVN